MNLSLVQFLEGIAEDIVYFFTQHHADKNSTNQTALAAAAVAHIASLAGHPDPVNFAVKTVNQIKGKIDAQKLQMVQPPSIPVDT